MSPATVHAPVTQVDVCIVGAGPSGAVAATRLAEDGFSVVVLERGDWPDRSTIRVGEPDFELWPGTEWLWRPDDRRGVGDQPIDERDSDVSALMWNGVGGSMVLFAAQWHRTMPSDFRLRSTEGIADDWPLAYDDLAPYYRRVEREFGISGLNGDPAFPGTAYPMPPVRLREWGSRLARAHNGLGWHWWPGSNAIATRPYGRLRACADRGSCMFGCAERAKSSPDITHWPDAVALGVRLVTRAHAIRIETDSRGRATGVVYAGPDGGEHRQRATVVILAANAVGTPWLLLSSASPNRPEGLGNSSGLVGRRLMVHPFGAVAGVFEDSMSTWPSPVGQQIYSVQFYETDLSRGFRRGAKWALAASRAPLGAVQDYPWGAADFWGEPFHETVRERMERSALWGIFSEDLPDEDNRVLLSPDVRDERGLPAPKLVYRVSDESKRLLRWHEARATESLEAAGATQVYVAPPNRNTGWHLLGTARMGHDPATSVVNGEGRCHDVPNLYVLDGSTWPTASGTNPTATIAALALRNTERLIAARRTQEVPA
jgi:choline dehydrogenase-like flavoprotein